ncbi:hypothetical protein Cni_G10114 [Canna indica]|uniref:Uncharacterized protein n=1 Tax=Canna indica TaxID=4628 RepID=A0AAQ3K3P7_9LILI|nr:hypothetical protein Cni_G10114 [Canna indica]
MAKKGTQQPPSADGVFPRNRSEIFLHRTLSGLASLVPNARRRRLLMSISSLPSPDPPSTTAGAHRRTDAAAIIDLRTRRVFTPASISIETSPVKTDAITPVTGGMELTDRMEDREEKARVDQGNRGADEVMEQSGGPEEDLFQSTPPDTLIAMEAESVSEDRTAVSAPETCADTKVDASPPPKSKPALARCSRSKLYRNPSSFSYRRLLPFLMNLEKDESEKESLVSCKDYPVKIDNFVEERKSLPLAEQLSTHQLMVGELECSVPLEPSWDCVDITNNKNLEKVPSSPVHGLQVSTTNLCNQIELDTDEFKSEACLDDPILNSMLHRSPSCSPTAIHEALLEEEMDGSVQALSCLPRKPELGFSTIGPESESSRKSPPRTPPLKFLHSSERHVLAPRKGILKKHSKGCKGICMCLDCVSFRIHADRAFEFSRKQMEEADEIILGLINEVAGLRKLVEKSVMPTSHGAGTSALLQLNQMPVAKVLVILPEEAGTAAEVFLSFFSLE